MSYTKTNWQNDQAPAINATNLNKIEQGIYDNDGNISSINGTLGVDTNTWVGTTAYGEGDIVIYNDKIYQNISGTSTTTNPAEDTTNWDEITIFDTDSINDDLIDKTEFIKNTNTNSAVNSYSCKYINDLTTYPSTSAGEIIIGYTSDGTPVYRKTIYITQQNQAHGIDNLFAVISTNAILNNFDYGWVNVSYDVVVQSSNVWLRDRALNNVGNGILLTIEYYKSS